MADNPLTDPGLPRRVLQDTSNVLWPGMVFGYVTGGSAGAWTTQVVDATHGLPVSASISDAQVQGKAAQDAVASGNPVLGGLVARRARITAMSADGDAVSATADRYGRTQTVGIDLSVTALQVTASGDTTLVATPGSGSRLKVLRVEGSNSHASTALVAGLKDASLNGGSTFGKKYLPAAGGLAAWVFPGGHLMLGDNEALTANLSALGQVEFTAYYEIVLS